MRCCNNGWGNPKDDGVINIGVKKSSSSAQILMEYDDRVRGVVNKIARKMVLKHFQPKYNVVQSMKKSKINFEPGICVALTKMEK
jgi:hypothetical protein